MVPEVVPSTRCWDVVACFVRTPPTRFTGTVAVCATRPVMGSGMPFVLVAAPLPIAAKAKPPPRSAAVPFWVPSTTSSDDPWPWWQVLHNRASGILSNVAVVAVWTRWHPAHAPAPKVLTAAVALLPNMVMLCGGETVSACAAPTPPMVIMRAVPTPRKRSFFIGLLPFLITLAPSSFCVLACLKHLHLPPHGTALCLLTPLSHAQ